MLLRNTTIHTQPLDIPFSRTAAVPAQPTQTPPAVPARTLSEHLNVFKALVSHYAAPAQPLNPQELEKLLGSTQRFGRAVEMLLMAEKDLDIRQQKTQQVADFLWEVCLQIKDRQKQSYFLQGLYRFLDGIPGLLKTIQHAIEHDPQSFAKPAIEQRNTTVALLNQHAVAASSAAIRPPVAKPSAAASEPYPTPYAVAYQLAERILREHYGITQLSPDQIQVEFHSFSMTERLFLGLMNLAAGTAAARLLEHSYANNGDIKLKALTFTEAVLQNFHRDKLSSLATIHHADHPALGETDIRMRYTDSTGNVVVLNPDKAADNVKTANLQQLYQRAVDDYWQSNEQKLIQQHNNRLHNAIRAQVTNNTLSESSAQFLSHAFRQPTATDQVRLLTMAGYPSTDITVFTPPNGRLIVYVPGDFYPLHEFEHDEQMRRWITARIILETKTKKQQALRQEAQNYIRQLPGFRAKKLNGSTEIIESSHGIDGNAAPWLSHFSVDDRLDGTILSGLDRLVSNIGLRLQGSGGRAAFFGRFGPMVLQGSESFSGYISAVSLASMHPGLSIAAAWTARHKQRHLSDGAHAIVSNDEVRRRAANEWLGYLELLALPLCFVLPEVGVPLYLAASASSLGLDLDQAAHGDTEEDRAAGNQQAFAEAVNLFSSVALEGGAKLLSIGATAEKAVAPVVETLHVPTGEITTTREFFFEAEQPFYAPNAPLPEPLSEPAASTRAADFPHVDPRSAPDSMQPAGANTQPTRAAVTEQPPAAVKPQFSPRALPCKMPEPQSVAPDNLIYTVELDPTTVALDRPEERKFLRVNLEESKQYSNGSRKVEPAKLSIPDGDYMFVNRADEPDVLRIADENEIIRRLSKIQNEPHVGHTSLAQNTPLVQEGGRTLYKPVDVYYAGYVKYKYGKVSNWSNASGHYKPPAELKVDNLTLRLRSLLPEKKFEACKW